MNNPQHKQRLQKVIRYIELNLQSSLTTDELAKEACYSSFHFHRLFKACTGENVYGFRKRLVLEQAAKKLMHNSHSITDIAFQAGYDNQSSFNKAFRQQYGVTPGQARLTPEVLFSQPLNQANQESVMQYEVELVRLKPVEVLCARATGPYKQAAESAWGQLMPYIYSNRLITGETRTFGISYDDPKVTEGNNIRYDACVDLAHPAPADSGLYNTTLAGGLYGRILHKGPYEGLPAAYSFLFAEWLAQQDHELRDAPCFEQYLNRDPRRTKPENLKTEIYIPLQK